jgi:hypothetical protein
MMMGGAPDDSVPDSGGAGSPESITFGMVGELLWLAMRSKLKIISAEVAKLFSG